MDVHEVVVEEFENQTEEENYSSEDNQYDPLITIQPRKRIGNIPDISYLAYPPYINPNISNDQNQNIYDKHIEILSQKLDALMKKLENQTIKPNIVQKAQEYLQNKIRNVIPKCQVKAFGGAVNGISSINGDIDCTLIYEDSDIYLLEQQGLKALLQNQELVKQSGVPLHEYYNLIEQFSEAHQELEKSLQQNEPAIYDNTLVYRRNRWRKVIIACLIISAFEAEEIEECVLKARIPVIKLQLKLYNEKIIAPQQYEQLQHNQKQQVKQISIDLCINNFLPLQNTMLIGEYMRQSNLVRQLILLVKEWATRREISLKNDLQMPNNYSFILLVIFYLQITDVVDNLQESTKIKIVNGYNCYFDQYNGKQDQYSSKQLAQYFLGFFHFYGYDFSFERAVISIRYGRALNRLEKQWFQGRGDINSLFKQSNKKIIKCEEKQLDEEQPEVDLELMLSSDFLEKIKIPIPTAIQNTQNINLHFCIEDPFEMNLNVCRNVDKSACSQIKREFRRGFSILKRKSQNPVEWLMFSPKIDELGAKGNHDNNMFFKMQKMQQKLDKGEAIHDIQTKVAVKKMFKFTMEAQQNEEETNQ